MSFQDSFCFSPDFVVVKELRDIFTPISGGLYKYTTYRYNFATRNITTFFSYYPEIDASWEIPNGTVLDGYQSTVSEVKYILFYGSTIEESFTYPSRKILKIDIVDGSLKFWVFNTSTKSVEVTIYPTTTPCYPLFLIAEDIVLTASCDGYTRNEWYHDGEGGVTITSTPNSVICGYVDPAENTDLTVNQLVRIEHCEPVNPLMLVWKNSLGGWDSWLFSKKQVFDIETKNNGFVGIPIWDIETAEETQKEISKSVKHSVTLGAENLSIQEKIGIQEVLSSNIAYQLFKDGSKRRVSVNQGSFISIDNDGALQNIEFTISLPDSYTISN